MYIIENYKDNIRFNQQYDEIRKFLQKNGDSGYNEHFHWGRFDWMMAHPNLDVAMLPRIALFRNENRELAGAVVYDTNFDDRWYLLHSTSDEDLLKQMIEYIAKFDADAATIEANLGDTALCAMLENSGFEQQNLRSVLEMDLSCKLSLQLPKGFYFNAPDSEIDSWQWRLVIYHGFDHEGIPQQPDAKVTEAEKHLETSEYIKVFVIKEKQYVAHCGIWYNGGDTAYIEPVATVPGHRGKGLGRAAVYEAMNRAKERGAKRAIVLSDQEFYSHIGMAKSSEIATWVKRGK